MALSIALCLALLAMLREGSVHAAHVLRATAVTGLFSAPIAAPKIVAAFMLMRQFPRLVDDERTATFAQGLAGLAAQLAGVQTLVPVFAATGVEVSRVYGAMLGLVGGVKEGMWELDAGLSPVVFACLALGGWTALRAPKAWTRTQAIAAGLFALGSWIVIEAALAGGLTYPILKTLPVFNALHVTTRLAAVFVLPLALLAAAASDPLLERRRVVAFAMVTAVWLSPLSYFALPVSLQGISFDVAPSLAAHAAVRRGERFEVERLIVVSDADALPMRASSLLPYDPLFGYDNLGFTPRTRAGDVRQVDAGSWNMTNPASLVFAAENGLQPFERIRESDRANLDALLSRRQPDWRAPMALRALIVAAVIATLVCVVTIVLGVRSATRAD